jgi:signal transduction histidine kinase
MASVMISAFATTPLQPLPKPLSRTLRLIASGGVAVVVLILGAVTYESMREVRASQQWVEHTHQVIDQTRAVLSDMKDAETGQRGFLLTADAAYLAPYNRALATLSSDTSALRELTADNAAAQQHLDTLAPLVTAKLAELDRTIALRRTEGSVAAAAAVATDRGKDVMDAIRATMGAMEANERALLHVRELTVQRRAEIATLILICGTLAAFVIAIILNSMLTRYADAQTHAARELDLQNAQLDAQNIELGNQALELELQNQQLQDQASELELQQQHLQDQATELEMQNEALQQQATELETQAEELQATTEELAERTEEAERTQHAAEQARLTAEAANRAKAEFLATMSHELRTPLNAIGGYVELMELGIRGAMTSEQLSDLARIKRSGRHLLGLINDILNFAKLEAGKVDFRITDVSVLDLVGGVEALVTPQMQAKGLHVSYDRCEPSIAVRADAEKVQQILLNLLTNAQKFTSAGGEIGIVCAVPSADTGMVTITVRDTGRGIPVEKLESIFEPFVQVDRHLGSNDNSQQGVGLGLAISRELARAMNGDLTAESTVGVGSIFALTLPRGVLNVVGSERDLSILQTPEDPKAMTDELHAENEDGGEGADQARS